MNWKFRAMLGVLVVLAAVWWIKLPSQATNEETAPTQKYNDLAAQYIRQVGEFSVVTPTAVGETGPIAEMDGGVVDAHLRRVFYMTKGQMREAILEQDAIAKGIPPEQYIQEINSLNLRELKRTIPGAGAGESFKDPLMDRSISQSDEPQAMPTPSLTFDGNGQPDNSAAGAPNVAPPDTIGDVGPNHYVQAVNLVFSIYNKTTGARLVGPLKTSSLWSGLPAGSPCRRDDGDPTVNYDQLADRWVVTQFGLPTGFTVPTYQCVAVSQTSDPAGAYYAYQYIYPNSVINDYPKFGVWRDAYYMTTNEFTNGGAAFAGAGMIAFDRDKMLQGDATALMIVRRVATSGGVLPTDIEGFGGPPTELDHIFLEFRADETGDPFDGLRAFRFKPDFVNPANTIFQVIPDVALAPFDPRNPPGRGDIEQLGGTNLESLSLRLMNRLTYRNLGTQAAPVNAYAGSFTVNVSGVAPSSPATYDAGIRWFELRRPANTTISVFDQGTQVGTGDTPGTRLNNWMGSIALDNRGDIALGYSQSGTTQNADIKIAGRTNNVAGGGMLNEGEALFHDATGAQTGNVNRWGDYSSLNLDTDDDCTMWYTQEYHATTSNFGWSTRVGKFKFPQCTPAPKATIQGTVTACAGGAPIAGALIDSTGGFARVTGAGGTYTMAVAPGTYTVTASKTGGFTSANQTVTVGAGETATVNLCLTGIAVVTAAGGPTITAESCGTPNNAPDPGETVTVTLPLQNTGGAATTNLTATLQATGGVTNPSPAQNYGALLPGGGAAARTFTFNVDPSIPCGGSITLTFAVSDGATTFPNITRTFTTGVRTAALSENFDAVTAPALPAGWTSTQLSGTANNWVTTTTNPSSAPNAAFASDPATTNLVALISPAVSIAGTDAQLSFKNRYNTEDTYDGMVLEYSTNNGTTWTDIITGGGTFVSGGYTDTLNTGFANPLPGRQAWSGNSGAYIDTVINLPASLNGQSVRFRWLMGSDSTIGVVAGGVWVDDVQILGARVCQNCNASCRIQRRGDFDGDGKTDYAVFRSGTWFIKPNGAGAAYGVNFGSSATGDKLQPVDYDGDGKTDIAVFRSSNGTWYWVRSSDNAVRAYQFGAPDDVPVASDYTGDGKAELAVYRPSTGVWYILDKENGEMTAVRWGGDATDVPVIGDFDNDCKTDIGVRRTTNETAPGATQFFILQSAGGAASIRWGTNGMQMAIGDYNGDGRSDIGVAAASGAQSLLYWYVISTTSAVLVNGVQFGQMGDIVTPGDYDGDGRTDLSVFRPSNGVFYYRAVANAAQFGFQFGASGDLPVVRMNQYPIP